MDNSEYCEIKLKDIVEELLLDLAKKKPCDIINYSMDWLMKKGGYTINGLTIDERDELLNLRKELKKYRELHEKNNDGNHSFDEDEEEHSDDEAEQAPEVRHYPKTSLRGPRIAVSAEAYGEFNKKGDFKPVVHKKHEDQITAIKSRLIHSFMFNSLESSDLKIVIDAMEEKKFAIGEVIINQGDQGDCLYIVEEGELNCFKKFSNGEEKLVKNYSPGETFGELALLYNCPRAAKVVAASNTVSLWKLDRETFNAIVKEAAMKRREKYENFLKKVEILSSIDPYELTQISDALKTVSFRPGDYVIKEGEMGDVFYMIEDGEAEATKTFEAGKPAQVVKRYRSGDYFGELALIKGEPRAANVVAVTDLKLVSLDRGSFKRLLGPIEDILRRNANNYTKYIK